MAPWAWVSWFSLGFLNDSDDDWTARSEYEANSASSQFFWLQFDSDLTPAGKNLLDGRYACFGYAVDGAELLKDVKAGDVITSTKIIKGLDKLVIPK